MSLVEIDGATLRYGALTALSGLDLRLEPGEVLGLLGHNGAGKTTTIKLVLGLLAPSEGRVRVLGHDARSLEARRQLGYLPENVTFYPQLSGAETLRHFARLKGVAPAEAARLLEQVGLGHAARRRLKTSRRACASASAWPRRCSANRACCCSTNRRWASTRWPPSSFTNCSTACAARAPGSSSAPMCCPASRRTSTAPRFSPAAACKWPAASPNCAARRSADPRAPGQPA